MSCTCSRYMSRIALCRGCCGRSQIHPNSELHSVTVHVIPVILLALHCSVICHACGPYPCMPLPHAFPHAPSQCECASIQVREPFRNICYAYLACIDIRTSGCPDYVQGSTYDMTWHKYDIQMAAPDQAACPALPPGPCPAWAQALLGTWTSALHSHAGRAGQPLCHALALSPGCARPSDADFACPAQGELLTGLCRDSTVIESCTAALCCDTQ